MIRPPSSGSFLGNSRGITSTNLFSIGTTASGTSTCLFSPFLSPFSSYKADKGVLALSKSLLELQGRQCLLSQGSLRLLVDARHKAWLLLVHDQQSIQVWEQGNLSPLEEIVTQNKIKIIQRNTKEVYCTFLVTHLNSHVLCQTMRLLFLVVHNFKLAIILCELQVESSYLPLRYKVVGCPTVYQCHNLFPTSQQLNLHQLSARCLDSNGI